MMITDAHIERLEKDYSALAGEPVTIDIICGTFYVFGSELACLRIFLKNRHCQDTHVEYSTNLNTWFYCHSTNL